MKINIASLPTGAKLFHPHYKFVKVEAVYHQGGKWKVDLRFDDGSLFEGDTLPERRNPWERVA